MLGQTKKTALSSCLSLAALVFLISFSIRLPLLSIPFERDEGEYSYIAWRMGYHEIPYRDWFDQKPPGVFWAYRIALMLPMDAIRSVHLVGALFAAGTALALFFLARRWLPDFWAAFAGIMFGVVCAQPSLQGIAANTELFMLLPLTLSLIPFVAAADADRPRIPLMLLCGALTGVAAAFKQVAAVNWLFLALAWPLVVKDGRKGRTTVLFAACSLAGAAIPWVILTLYFAARGAFADFLDNVLFHNLEYAGRLSWNDRWGLLLSALQSLAPSQVVIWFFSLAGIISIFGAGRAKWGIVCLLWALTSMAGVAAGGYFFGHYFLQLLPWLCLMAAIGAAAVANILTVRRIPLWLGRSAILAAALAMPLVTLAPFLFKYSPEEAVTKIYPENRFALMPALGRRLAEITAPDERVFIFGAEPELLFYARRASATRYIFLFPLYGPYSNVTEKQIAVTEEIAKARPGAALLLPNQLFFTPGTEQYFTSWSLNYLNTNFVPDRWILQGADGEYVIGLANNAPPPNQPLNSLGVLLKKK
jgi:4-amino-4-deoxy-L-arabinose transferase-like glycosyltransferase